MNSTQTNTNMEANNGQNMANKDNNRTPCEIYTRVMGYYRPVSQFNQGKKSEHYSRVHFKENTSLNHEFAKKYEAKEDESQ